MVDFINHVVKCQRAAERLGLPKLCMCVLYKYYKTKKAVYEGAGTESCFTEFIIL